MLVPVVALATAGVAAAANGGFTPQHPHSPNARHINTAYYLIFGFTAAIFVIVETALVVFIWRYRSRGRSREVEGAQVHGNTRLEMIWTVVPVVILAVIGIFIFWELPKIVDVPAASASDRLNITVEGHQFYWQFDYPNGARSIGELHVPAGRSSISRSPRPTSRTAGGSRSSAARPMRFPAGRTTRGSRPTAKARSPASAPSSAASTTRR